MFSGEKSENDREEINKKLKVVACLVVFMVGILGIVCFISAMAGKNSHIHKGNCTVANYSLTESTTNILEGGSWHEKPYWTIYWIVSYISVDYPRIQNKQNDLASVYDPNKQHYRNLEDAYDVLNQYSINRTYTCSLNIGNTGINNDRIYQIQIGEDGVTWGYTIMTAGIIVAITSAALIGLVSVIGLCSLLGIYYSNELKGLFKKEEIEKNDTFMKDIS